MAIQNIIVSQVEDCLRENNVKDLIELAGIYKERGIFHKFLGYSYCQGISNIFHAAVKYANCETIVALFNHIVSEMGEKFLRNETDKSLDKVGRTVLIIAAKHREPEIVYLLLNKYNSDPSFYPSYNGKSALSYAIQRKKNDTALALLHKMNTSGYNRTNMEYFRSDMLLLRQNVSENELCSTEWLTALTSQTSKHGRASKLFKMEFEERTRFSGKRVRQILRHVASLLYFRWKYHLGISELRDVQIMLVQKKVDKLNPNPKPSLLISFTPLHVADKIKTDFKLKTFKEMTTTEYDEIDDTEEYNRSIRFSRKLQDRVWGNDFTKITKESRDVAFLLKTDHRKVQKILKINGIVKLPYFSLTENNACLLHPYTGYDHSSQHAEYFLCEAADSFKENFNVILSIYGKNRPCLTCTARMKVSKISKYNPHSGLLSLRLVGYQSDIVAKETLNVLFSKPSHVTHDSSDDSSQGIREYDTGSESE